MPAPGIDVLVYAAPLVWELEPRMADQLGELEVKARIALCDPDCAHAMERDALEQLSTRRFICGG